MRFGKVFALFNVRYNFATPTRRYKKLREAESRASIMRAARQEVVKELAAYIMRRSKTRHKTAERFGISPTGILEFTAVGAFGASKGGGKIYARNMGGGKTSIFISGVPFIQKAFRPLTIVPKKASALTIPLCAQSARKSAGDLAAQGWSIFRPRGKDVLLGRKSKRGKIVALYALRQSVKIPRDPTLLPYAHIMDVWTARAIRKELER